jgi:hypothetical protein
VATKVIRRSSLSILIVSRQEMAGHPFKNLNISYLLGRTQATGSSSTVFVTHTNTLPSIGRVTSTRAPTSRKFLSKFVLLIKVLRILSPSSRIFSSCANLSGRPFLALQSGPDTGISFTAEHIVPGLPDSDLTKFGRSPN